MKWDLRMAAARREIWKASDLRRLLAEYGLEISVGKMSNLWSGQPTSVRLDDLEVICTALDCSPEELLVRQPGTVERRTPGTTASAHADAADQPVKPLRRSGRSAPP
ncbi:helix-turn-helix transcriptional regulator [Streptomyces sp. NPDC050619]|uniref:helix-turn-helix domain-containing protein n=1 Tax=Streptomyces sp. NPDC050619 TaxID=3157214 RepID=UPI0034221AC1